MKSRSLGNKSLAATLAIVLLTLLTANVGPAHASASASATGSRSWATRYGHALDAHRAAPHRAVTQRTGRLARPDLSSFGTAVDVITKGTSPFPTGNFESTPTIAIDPAGQSQAGPNTITASTDGLVVDLSATTNNFGVGTTGTAFQDRRTGGLINAIKDTSSATIVSADGGIEPSAAIGTKGTGRKGMVTFAAYTNNSSNYANGIAYYPFSYATNKFSSTPTPIAGYVNSVGSGAITVRVYDEPSVAYDNSATSGTNGIFYVAFVRSYYDAVVGSAPGTYRGSDVLLTKSSDGGATWSLPTVISGGTNASSVCTKNPSYTGTASPCDDVYYPSVVVTAGGNVWVAFLTQSTASTPGARGKYVLASVAGGTGVPTISTTAFPVNNSAADYDPLAGGQQTLPGGQFYTNANGNLAYDNNTSVGNDGILLLSYAHATTAGNAATWGVVNYSIPVNTGGTTGSASGPATFGGAPGNEALFPHIANRPSGAGAGTLPAVGYYVWNGSKITYTIGELQLTYAGASLSTNGTLSSSSSFTPGDYLGEYTGLDMNAVNPTGSTDNSRVYGTYQAPGTAANDPADQWVQIDRK